MPKFSGLFENFLDLDKIPVTDIVRWLKSTKDTSAVENAVANRILYPQTIPTTQIDLEIDFAVLKEVLIRNPELLLDKKNNRIIIPENYEARFHPLTKLITLICETNKFPPQVINIYAEKGSRLLGSVIAPVLPAGSDQVVLQIANHSKNLNRGKVYLLPLRNKQETIALNKQNLAVTGGEIGVVVKL